MVCLCFLVQDTLNDKYLDIFFIVFLRSVQYYFLEPKYNRNNESLMNCIMKLIVDFAVLWMTIIKQKIWPQIQTWVLNKYLMMNEYIFDSSKIRLPK